MKLGSLETSIDQGGDCDDIKKKKMAENYNRVRN